MVDLHPGNLNSVHRSSVGTVNFLIPKKETEARRLRKEIARRAFCYNDMTGARPGLPSFVLGLMVLRLLVLVRVVLESRLAGDAMKREC